MTRLRNGYGIHKKAVTIITIDGMTPAAKISLGKGRNTVISLSDISILEEHSFYGHQRQDGHWVARSSQTGAYLHRLIMKPDNVFQEVDHINSDPLNNMRGNLRLCSKRQNNIAKRQNVVEGFNGIVKIHGESKSFTRINGLQAEVFRHAKYQAITPCGKQVGSHKTASAAAMHRDELLKEGDYADSQAHEQLHTFGFINWNFPDCPKVKQQVKAMNGYLTKQKVQAFDESMKILKEKGWKCSS